MVRHVALNAFNERMGVIEIIGVDPDFQRRGIATQLTRHALDHMRRGGMDIAAVEQAAIRATRPHAQPTKRLVHASAECEVLEAAQLVVGPPVFDTSPGAEHPAMLGRRISPARSGSRCCRTADRARL